MSNFNAVDFDAPLTLVISTQGSFRLSACNKAAAGEGLSIGQLVTDARALCPGLQVLEATPEADARALRQLAAWATRYTPWVAPATGVNGIDGIFLDITGCAHLFGSEKELLTDLLRRLKEFDIAARACVTGTLGASWALARYGKGSSVLNRDAEAQALAPLPISALRLSDQTAEGLLQVGLKRIGDLAAVARAPLASRFGPEALMRLDQALGKASEPVMPQILEAPLRVRNAFVDPLVQTDAMVLAIEKLCAEMEVLLLERGRGARALKLTLFRVDGETATLEVGTARGTTDAAHLARLLAERLDQLSSDLDIGFGYDAAILDIPRTDALAASQVDLSADQKPFSGDLSSFMDRAGNRFGWARVQHVYPVQSHIPERAVMAQAAHVGPPSLDWAEEASRPAALLPCAEPIEVLAEVPEGPPKTFRWRKVAYRVSRAEGPERIAPEWWRAESASNGVGARTRDYFRVEDDGGRRFWIYREGLYGREATTPRWYMHGFLD